MSLATSIEDAEGPLDLKDSISWMSLEAALGPRFWLIPWAKGIVSISGALL